MTLTSVSIRTRSKASKFCANQRDLRGSTPAVDGHRRAPESALSQTISSNCKELRRAPGNEGLASRDGCLQLATRTPANAQRC